MVMQFYIITLNEARRIINSHILFHVHFFKKINQLFIFFFRVKIMHYNSGEHNTYEIIYINFTYFSYFNKVTSSYQRSHKIACELIDFCWKNRS